MFSIRVSLLTLVLIGVCNSSASNTFYCTCALNWQGVHCETPINHCSNVTCLNNGVCRSSFSSFTCECPGGGFSGRYCEVKARQLETRQAASRSFAYVAICALVMVMLFIVTLDVMKYYFGIDSALEDRKRPQKKTTAKNHTIVRFIYVHA